MLSRLDTTDDGEKLQRMEPGGQMLGCQDFCSGYLGSQSLDYEPESEWGKKKCKIMSDYSRTISDGYTNQLGGHHPYHSHRL